MNTSFERTVSKDEWLTPKHIIDALGPFDLDPCASVVRPWPTAAKHCTVEDDGLKQPWSGFVWCNPPYGKQTGVWLKRMAEHNNGIALTFARTETRMFFDTVWREASALLFLKGRLSFVDTSGKAAANSAGAPSVLIAYGHKAKDRIFRAAELSGAFVEILKGCVQ